MSFRALSLPLLFLASASMLAACGDDAVQQLHVQVPFGALLAQAPFEAGECADGVGTEGDAIAISDLRFYIADVHAQNDAGEWRPLQLSQRAWQGNGITLIDLSALEAESGTAGMNNYIDGHLPEDSYRRLRFTLGVPFEENHSNAATAEAPLNVGGMFWSWQGGRKFLRIDAQPCGDRVPESTPNSLALHLGSTGCEGEMTQISHCAQANRSIIELDWSPGQSVMFDLDALFAESNIYANTEETPSLCMSAPSDPDCAPLFGALGLPFGSEHVSAQRSFIVSDQSIAPHATGVAPTGGEFEDDHDHDPH